MIGDVRSASVVENLFLRINRQDRMVLTDRYEIAFISLKARGAFWVAWNVSQNEKKTLSI
jgi:hypothetical protein